MKYYLAEVQDMGNFYKILSIIPNTSDTLMDFNNKLLPLSKVSHSMIEEAIKNDQIVHIKNPIEINEVIPSDLIITEQDPLIAYREANLIKVKTLVTPEITKESAFTMYEFMMMHTELLDKGYNIYDGNREEKYIEIIETEDEDLINLLEKYLESKDKISRAYFLKDKYDNLVKETLKARTQEEIKKLCDNFISKNFK